MKQKVFLACSLVSLLAPSYCSSIELTTSIFPEMNEQSSMAPTCFAYLNDSFKKAILELGMKYHAHDWSQEFRNLYQLSKEGKDVAEYELLAKALEESLLVLECAPRDAAHSALRTPIENYRTLLNSSEIIDVTLVEQDALSLPTKGKCKKQCAKFCKLIVCDLTVCNLTVNGNGAINTLFVIRNATINGNAAIGGNLAVAGDEAVGGDLAVAGSAAIIGNLVVTGTITSSGSPIAGGAYGYIYNVGAGVIALEAPILFDTNGPLLGVTHTPGSASINIVAAGTYAITFSVSGVEPSQFTLFVNGAPSTSTTYGSGAGTQQNNGQAILTLGAGDIITLVNHTSAAAVTLQTLAGGTAINVNASVLIEKLA